MTLEVAIVTRDPAVREAAARAFGAAPPQWSIRLCDEVPGEADVVVAGPDVDAPGAIAFDPSRPQEALDAVAAARSSARMYVVAAVAGGAGATTVALHLAATFGAGTCYAEVASRSDRLGLPDDARTWLPRDDDVALSALPVAGGFRILRAPLPCPGPDAFPLGAVRAGFDRVVLDAGADSELGCLTETAATAIVVTTPTRPAALAARRLMEAIPDVTWGVVVNRVGPGGQIMRAGIEQLLGRPVTVELPCCPALRDAEDEARLLRGTWRRWSRGIAGLARALDRC